MATLAVNQLQLAPLGAGDLIDRTVRLYRRHFMALIRASAPPVVISSIGSVLYSIGVRSIALTESEGRLALYFLLALMGPLFWFIGGIAQLIVMGGASRNLVMHLLSDEPVTARLIYRSVRSRFWGLFGATMAVVISLIISSVLASVALFVTVLLIILVAVVTVPLGATWLTAILSILLYLAGLLATLYIFFLIGGRVAYVPQVLMVEGKGVMASVSRSAQLARGNVRRLMALFLFITFATYSALMLLMVPLGWVGYLNGINPFEMDASRLPVWYSISSTVFAQVAAILLAPVWMLGLSLLYVDERVRHEGYDVELLASQRFGDMPELPGGAEGPLAPALAAAHVPTARAPDDEERFPGSVLGLTDRS
ncbi:MAG TPA: hypothetical protein VFS10_15310 [Pyrinomonadaceae bacterium]|nr:hypothetical protein [Pyrinomonadaceae bacterium]